MHVHDVGAEALARQLEGRLRARRNLEVQVDERASAEDVALLVNLSAGFGGSVGEIEELIDLLGAQTLACEEVAPGEVE